MSAFKAFSSILSPSWKSMARLVLPSRLELKRPEGSSNEAPLATLIAVEDYPASGHKTKQNTFDLF
jgi:hypothetical protein